MFRLIFLFLPLIQKQKTEKQNPPTPAAEPASARRSGILGPVVAFLHPEIHDSFQRGLLTIYYPED